MHNKTPIYLDNNAATFIAPTVFNILVNAYQDFPGNPSSIHQFGQKARQQLTKAKNSIAAYLGVKPQEIIFSSCGTESANLILQGLLAYNPQGHIVTSSAEHPCVYETIKILESRGCSVTFIDPDSAGAIDPKVVEQAIQPNTRLIALMAANNETGVLTDIQAIGVIAQNAKIPFFVDGVALLGKESFAIPDGVSAMSFSGHKIHAPKGTGFAFVRSSLKLTPLLHGGKQEQGRRAGSENLEGIIGLAEAIRLLQIAPHDTFEKMRELRDRLENGLQQKLDGVSVNGLGPRISNTSNLSFAGVEGETLLAALDMEGIAVSHGSACASGALEPSRVLLNMGISREAAASSIRFSLSRMTTVEEIERTIEITVALIERLRMHRR